MKPKYVITIATLFLLSGCGATWINLDDTRADLDKINAAKAKCNHDSTLLKLQAEETKKDAKVIATSSIAEKKALEEAYEAREKQVYAKLNDCMASHGLKPLH
ncbi:MAG: hypothetical protein QNJ85_14925 [Gammaproteobacteria bacterium]|nr:hypothetical protein [Gammaproteobacteria bacterium]